jgi:hypothetical protein
MQRAFDETRRILVNGGLFVLAVPHPRIYVEKPRTGWASFDYESFVFETDKQVPVTIFAGNGQNFSVSCYPHSEEEYQRSLNESGFQITKKAKPLASSEDLTAFPDRWGAEDVVPFYLIYACRKKG